MTIDRRAFAFCAGAMSLAPLTARTAAAGEQDAFIVVSPPNPHVFPLILGLAERPELKIIIKPVKTSADAKAAMAAGADAMLAMTYVAAAQAASGELQSLQLVLPTTWRGFWEVAGPGVASFRDLKGKSVVVSGPVGPGKGGGGDAIFRAAARRQGIDPDHELNVVYAPIQQGYELVKSGNAAAIAVPAPASTGMALATKMGMGQLRPVIDFQSLFGGFSSFPVGQLPLGGLHATAATLNVPGKRAQLINAIAAYAIGVSKLAQSPLLAAMSVSKGFGKLYNEAGAPPPPAPVLAQAISNGDLVYRTDIGTPAIRADLAAWLMELNGTSPPPSFLAAPDFSRRA